MKEKTNFVRDDVIELSDSDISSDTIDDVSFISRKKYKHPIEIYNELNRITRISVCNRILSHSDFLTLCHNAWLNDKIINCYLELLSKYNNHVKIFNTHFYPNLIKNPEFDGRELSKTDMNKKLFIFPINNRFHWSLLIFDKEFLKYYDSLPQLNVLAVKVIKKYLMHKFNLPRLFVKNMINFPKQSNSDDCGVYLCQYTKYIIYDLQIFSSSDINSLRAQMLHELLICEIIYH
ncbi:SENP2 [Hepatospora eriocheir]|uniref:SENP2 n=1 Tax=Hepatospora eriocheir TaxID=1081669 RepID=A0A1X0Q854_9MICR|nr:SENP2 [Hepatospora eriocheir]